MACVVRRWSSVLVVLGTLALAGPVSANDEWTEPAPGVRHLSRTATYSHTPSDQYRAEALVIDLTHPQVDIAATPPSQKGGTVSDYATRNDLEAAWNTNFFANPSTPCGLTVGGGQAWQTAYDDGCDASVGVGDGRAAVFEGAPIKGPPPESWMTEVGSGTPGPILVDGQPQFSYGCGTWCNYQPRTGIGVGKEGEILYVVVVDGRQNGSVGAGLDDLANILKELGAWDAINLDGGGSSAMYVADDGGIVNNPSGGAERTVCCHMGVAISERTPSDYGASLVDRSPAPGELAPGATAEVWVAYANAGDFPWKPGGGYPVRLGTADPKDRTSPFRHASWASDTRVGPVPEQVAPGESARWRFQIRAPEEPGTYREAFAPVAEDMTWMDGGPVEWTFEVEAPAMDAGGGDGMDASSDTGRRVDDAASGGPGSSDGGGGRPSADGRDGGGGTVTTSSGCSQAGGSSGGSPRLPLLLVALVVGVPIRWSD